MGGRACTTESWICEIEKCYAISYHRNYFEPLEYRKFGVWKFSSKVSSKLSFPSALDHPGPPTPPNGNQNLINFFPRPHIRQTFPAIFPPRHPHQPTPKPPIGSTTLRTPCPILPHLLTLPLVWQRRRACGGHGGRVRRSRRDSVGAGHFRLPTAAKAAV